MSDQATCELLSEDPRSKVWRWSFESGQETGMHIHEYDYIAIPISGGDFTATMNTGEVLEFTQIAGTPYQRQAGVHHNVRFVGEGSASFVEVEFLK
jgi:quercetin dioxygenase-like cupin family protein